MGKYKLIIKNFITDVTYIIPVLITSLLSFGFVLTHSSVNIDTLAYDRYFNGNALLAQSRFTAPLLDKIFNIMQFNPFFVDCLAVLFLILSSILFCSLFKIISNNKINPIAYTIFSCILISYPLLPEIFTYTPASLNICLSYCLIAFSLILSYENIKYKKKYLWIPASIITCLTISLYESFASVYLLGIFMILILEFFYNIKSKKTFSEFFLFFVKLLFPLVLGFFLELIISISLIKLLKIATPQYANKTITYQTLGIFNGLKSLLKTVSIKYFIASVCYLPITFFALCSIISILYGIISSVKYKKITIFLLFLGLFLSAISLSLIQGTASPYRTCQTFALFVGFIFMILSNNILNIKFSLLLKKCLIVILFILIFYQCKDIHHWFYINYLRYEEEKTSASLICYEIAKKCNINKPIVILGSYELSNNILSNINVSSDSLKGEIIIKLYDIFNYTLESYGNNYIYRISETNINSYIAWGNVAFGEPGIETVKFFNLLGYNYTCAPVESYEESKLISSTLPKWPKENSIIEYDNYILVNL